MQSLGTKPAPIEVQAKSLRSKPVLSTCLALLAILLLGDALVRFVQPLQYVSDPRLRPIQYDSWVAKFPRFFESNANPDLVIIGSSLPMAAFGRYDAIFDRNESLKNAANLRAYLDSKYFLHLLNSLGKNNSTAAGNVGSIGNLTCAGCMVSDAFAISDRVLTKKQTPKLVIFGIAPRDFQDNRMPDLGKSPVFLTFPFREKRFEWRDCQSPAEFLNTSLSFLFDFYDSRAKWRQMLNTYSADILNHPQSIYADAAQNFKSPEAGKLSGDEPSSKKKLTLEEDLADYKGRYNPFNQKRLNIERDFFEKLLDRLSDLEVPVVLVRMPITAENRALIPAPLADGFEQAMDSACTRSNVQFLSFEPEEFTRLDFADSVHLNESGSKKFQEKVARKLVSWAENHSRGSARD